MVMKFPDLAHELIELFDVDQRELREFSNRFYDTQQIPDSKEFRLARAKLRNGVNKRSKRIEEIIQHVGAPTISNIGKEGSEALAVLALHSTLDIMKNILRLFSDSYKNNNHDTEPSLIPALHDRVCILQHHKQKFGTQWLLGEDGKPFLYPIENFGIVNSLRASYGLKPISRPRLIAREAGIQDKPIAALTTDQRQPTSKEFEEYSSGQIT